MGHDDRPTLDAVHRCLGDERQRTVIEYLRETEDGTASLDDLADHVVEGETNSPAPDRETVTYELCHVHLPMLTDHGTIDVDEWAETVRYRRRSEADRGDSP
jgi:hypothetical protein